MVIKNNSRSGIMGLGFDPTGRCSQASKYLQNEWLGVKFHQPIHDVSLHPLRL